MRGIRVRNERWEVVSSTDIAEGYVHVQNVPVTSLTVAHNQGGYRNVQVSDLSGNVRGVAVRHLDVNRVEVTLNQARAFRVVVN